MIKSIENKQNILKTNFLVIRDKTECKGIKKRESSIKVENKPESRKKYTIDFMDCNRIVLNFSKKSEKSERQLNANQVNY